MFSDKPVEEAQGAVGPRLKLFFLRRGAGVFAHELGQKLSELRVTKIHASTQSESEGRISLTVFYE